MYSLFVSHRTIEFTDALYKLGVLQARNISPNEEYAIIPRIRFTER